MLGKFSTKLTKNRSLETRPISLPGLTSDLSVFINNISLVFNQKVVLCLDELDKISDPSQLDNLLKGIKGILGQKNLYFILTVSEDALSSFVTRFRENRNLIESSFEEIIHLKRIDISLSQRILKSIYITDDELNDNITVERNYLLTWAFSGGIPRELKRNLLKLRDSNINIHTSNSFIVWQFFFKQMILSLKDWLTISNFPDKISSRLLFFIEKVEESISSSNKVELKSYSTWLLKELGNINDPKKDFLCAEIFEDEMIEKSLLELFVCSLFSQISYYQNAELYSRAELLQGFLVSISYSTIYTKKKIYDLLKD